MIKAYWYKDPAWVFGRGNVGDILAPIVLEYVFRPVDKTFDYYQKQGKLLSIGSVAEFLDDGDTVWGSGLISADTKIPEGKQNVTILACRGKLTADALRKVGYEVPALYGDPAILMPDIYWPIVEKKHKLKVIPHYVEKEAFTLAYPGVPQINIINRPYDFIDQLLECERIITSSLHAYILAKVYGITAEYVQLTSKIIGGYFKYGDFLTGFDYSTKNELKKTLQSWSLTK